MDASKNVTMIDVDLDGNLDLLIGTSTGSLEYWRNLGTTSFVLTNDKYLGLGESLVRKNVTAVAGDLDHDGHEDLVLGDDGGTISIYSNFRSAGSSPVPVTEVIYDSFAKLYKSKNLGGSLRPIVVNLLGTDKPEIIVGNALGGLHVLRNDNGSYLSDSPFVTLSPVPARSDQSISVESDRPVTMQIYTALGQQIGSPIIVPANEIIEYPLQGVSAGIYIARFTAGSKSIAIRFIVL